ncbi:MAG: T9SS type A sorting domain-containing protein [Bacteroidota bacterium]
MKQMLLLCTFVFLCGNSHAYAQWVQTSGPYGGTVYSLTMIGSNIFAGTDSGIFISSNKGAIWNAVNIGLKKTVVQAFAAYPNVAGDTNLYAGTGNGVLLSTDNGTTWNATEMPYSIKTLVVSPDMKGGANLFAGTSSLGGGEVYLSTNNGMNWNRTSLEASIKILAVSPTWIDGMNIYAGTFGDGVFVSTNNGSNWDALNNGLTYQYVLTLVVRGTNLFAGTYGAGVFFSTNSGASWRAVNKGLTSGSIFTLMVAGTNLFAGTGDGVFLSTDNGTNWTSVNAGLEGSYGMSLAVFGTDLFVGTLTGVWRRPLSEMITSVYENSGGELPKSFALEQNYPNPFNPSTQIHFSLPKAGYVSLKIYDLLGKDVATLIAQDLHAGNYTTDWNATSIASGVYIYRLQAGNYIETKKLVLMK